MSEVTTAQGEGMTDSQPPKRKGVSPALLIFLLFPLLGFIAAGIFLATNNPAASGSRTPEPVTLAPTKVVADAPMIDFTLTSLDGKTVHLSDYQGRIVFLNFWATWCTPCQRELPAFQQFLAQQTANGPTVLSVDVAETSDQINAFLTKFVISGLNVLIDSDAKVSNLYGIFSMPTTFVIDEQGIVRYPKYGAMTIEDLNSYVTALKAE
ncbi:MAG: TlpA disulfide reductase family protein [Chloroflexota bacterium]